MTDTRNQLSLFKRKTFPARVQKPILEADPPTGESSVMRTLPAYLAHLQAHQYAASTIEKYVADVKRFSVSIREKKLGEIRHSDIEQWIASLVSPHGDGLERKSINRKVSAVINYFTWVDSRGILVENPSATIQNARIQSPLPDYLFEDEIKRVYVEASKDSRLYLLVLLFLETGIKSNEIFTIRRGDIDISDPYRPECWIKHRKKDRVKDRKVALPQQFIPAYEAYVTEYTIEEILFPYTDRFIQLLFADLKNKTNMAKTLTPKTLRHTHVVQAYKRGEDSERIFDRIGLAPDSRKEADEMYSRLARRGI